MPLIIRGRSRKYAIWASFVLLFILFGCQYEMTRDWPVYVNRWLYATEGMQTQDRELEVVYTLIMKLCKPLGFFGYLMVCAVFNLWVIKKYIDKYVPPELVWFTLAIFLLRVNFAFTYIDTNRQTLAIMCTMLGLFCVMNPPGWIKNKITLYIICAALLIAAVNIHTSAIIALPIFFFPWICEKIRNTKFLWIFMGVYFFSYFVDFNAISSLVGRYMLGSNNLSGFAHYAEEIAERSKSIVEQGIYGILLFFLIYKFDNFRVEEKPLVLSVIVFISLQGYAMYTMMRALFYYQVYSIFVVPLLFRNMLASKRYKLLVYGFFTVFIAYCLFSFERDIVHENFENWANFKTIFSAPVWL